MEFAHRINPGLGGEMLGVSSSTPRENKVHIQGPAHGQSSSIRITFSGVIGASVLFCQFRQGECIQPQASEDRAGTARATLPLQTDKHGAGGIAGGKL